MWFSIKKHIVFFLPEGSSSIMLLELFPEVWSGSCDCSLAIYR